MHYSDGEVTSVEVPPSVVEKQHDTALTVVNVDRSTFLGVDGLVWAGLVVVAVLIIALVYLRSRAGSRRN